MATTKPSKRAVVSSPARARRAPPAPAPPPAAPAAEERPIVVTTVRIYLDQLVQLQTMALTRRADARRGRSDASALIRELLDQVLPGKMRS